MVLKARQQQINQLAVYLQEEDVKTNCWQYPSGSDFNDAARCSIIFHFWGGQNPWRQDSIVFSLFIEFCLDSSLRGIYMDWKEFVSELFASEWKNHHWILTDFGTHLYLLIWNLYRKKSAIHAAIILFCLLPFNWVNHVAHHLHRPIRCYQSFVRCGRLMTTVHVWTLHAKSFWVEVMSVTSNNGCKVYIDNNREVISH